MARVTVEDCVLRIPNRFELVMLAAQRARDIASGAELTIDRDRDRNPVVALREIAEVTVPSEQLRETIVQGLQRHVEVDEPEDDELEFGAAALQFETEIQGSAPVEGEGETGKGEAPEAPESGADESGEEDQST